MALQIEKIDTFAGHRDAIYALSPAKEPQQFYSSGSDGLVIRWDLTKPDLGELIARIPASVYALAYDESTDLLWVGQNFDGIHRINPITLQQQDSIQLTSSQIFDIKLFEDLALVAQGDGTVTVLDRASFQIRKHLKASEASARSLDVNPHSREFAVGYSDCTIKIFDLDTLTLKFIIAAHTHSVFSVRYSPNGRFLVSGGRDAHLKSWKVGDPYQIQQDVVAHMFAINHITFSPDYQKIITASMDKTLKIWDAQTLRLLKVLDWARFAGHRTSINKVLWLPLESGLISVSDDRLISIWKVTEQV
ncbi:WD40 repeat domain-containing protein [Siphonobacter sp. SORGH_AS_1065]|uniref:WD40 repeat domain-containing protein n=1 Tax=Siphonobacter sp. SORGH_AS_1065 TaxID=3041795 RepID=UPI0027868BA4|nr:WD40 repeat domain-containing protein [Siphonobacter sp. SORGH_AS_1065]MDQ1086213.1 WD40 repeat protein [Siphonobacter sp. SORGH_AS_1065]